MLGSAIPAKFPLTWAQNAAAQFVRNIPSASQIATQPGAASLNDGFPPVTCTPVTSGGVPPFGQDANGILRQITQWLQFYEAGGAFIPVYDSAFSTSVGGYPKGAVLANLSVPGFYWISAVDNNTSNPDTGGANWVTFSLYGTLTTGDVKLSFKTVADPGWILMNDGSIGDASSGATTLANAVTQPLFTLMYNNIVDAWAPIQTSGGGATTRGAQGTASAAYAAHCRLVLPKVLGRAIATAGAGIGLTARALGGIFGEENHTLLAGELPAHQHNQQSNTMLFTGGTGALAGSPNSLAAGGVTDGGIGLNGSPHNNIQPSTYFTVMVSL